MKGWLGRTYWLRAGHITDNMDLVSQFTWMRGRDAHDRAYRWKPYAGLGALGFASRLCAEGAAPYLYEMRQGEPQYGPDEHDTMYTYPMEICIYSQGRMTMRYGREQMD